ncbi:hypothetical protein, partial [Rhodopseudomonas sp.]|uniref:hypothetical protein n=1 Tax=Rhodopseudomonas sp. TaxID=1078 RepID=UPI0025CCDA5A
MQQKTGPSRHAAGDIPFRPYSESRLGLPSKTPASGGGCTSAVGPLNDWYLILGLVQPVQCMQRPHRQFGIGGVDQHRKL